MQQTRLQCGSIKTIRERDADIITKHKTPTARDCSALLLMSPMRRGRGGWLLVTDD